MNLGTIVRSDVLLGLIVGLLVGWIVGWIWDLRLRRRDAAEHEEEIAALQQSVDNALVSKSAMQHELQALQEAHTEILARNDSLDDLVQQFQTKQASLEQEMSDSRTQLRKMASIQQANDTLRNKLNSAEARARELTTQMESVSGDAQTLSTVQAELEQSRARVEQLETDKLTLRDKLAHTETELAAMGAQYSTNVEDMGDVAQLQQRYAQAQSDLERLRANQTTSTADSERIQSMRAQIEELESRLETAEEALVHEQNRVVGAEVKLQNMADKLTDERLRAQSVEQELDSIRSGEAPANAARMRAEMAAQQYEIRELRAKLNAEAEAASSVDPQATQILPPANGTADPQQASANEQFPSWVRRASTRQQPVTAMPEATSGSATPDRLQTINGIGNVFAERLREAGVDSFAKLGELTPERASEIVRAKSWQAVDASSWIEQAKQFASGDVA